MEKSILAQLIDVIAFSAEKHKRQFRKDGCTPYINHPIQVAQILIQEGEDDLALLSAALLHDTIEDTGTSTEEISEKFGEEIMDLVLEVTDDKRLSKYERKQAQIDTSPFKSKKAKVLKIADKICNVRDIIHRPPKNWSVDRKMEYLDWAEQVVDGIRGTNEGLENIFDQYIKKGRDKWEDD